MPADDCLVLPVLRWLRCVIQNHFYKDWNKWTNRRKSNANGWRCLTKWPGSHHIGAVARKFAAKEKEKVSVNMFCPFCGVNIIKLPLWTSTWPGGRNKRRPPTDEKIYIRRISGLSVGSTSLKTSKDHPQEEQNCDDLHQRRSAKRAKHLHPQICSTTSLNPTCHRTSFGF